MTEEWRAVRGYEGLYEVSNLGRVKSLVKRGGCHGEIIEARREKTLTPYDNGSGYKMVSLKKSAGERNPRYIHRLVAEAFLANAEGQTEVNHLDYDKSNNRVDNLEWCDRQRNIDHSVKHMKKEKSVSRPTNTGEKYIYSRRNHYRVHVTGKPEKLFHSLEAAVMYRNEVMQRDEYFTG